MSPKSQRIALRAAAISIACMSVVALFLLHRRDAFWREHERQRMRRVIRAFRNQYDERTDSNA